MKAALLALTATLALTTGCVLSTNAVLAGDPLDADFLLTWAIEDAATSAPLDCALAGADTVRVTARNIDTGDVAINLFDCGSASGTTATLDAGRYFVYIDLLSCGTSPTCDAAPIVSRAKPMGPYGVWTDATYDLGHFVFLVQ